MMKNALIHFLVLAFTYPVSKIFSSQVFGKIHEILLNIPQNEVLLEV